MPWLASFIVAIIPSFIIRSTAPITASFVAEAVFFIYCTAKLLLKFNKPTLPEPILRDKWEDVAEMVWASQKDVASSREYLMGWYYDAPFERLRVEDALSYLAWMKHGVPYERNMLTEDELNHLQSYDLPLLTKKVNKGRPLPARQPHEEPLPVMRFNCEPLRYRHKPLLFYGITHGINFALHKILKGNNFEYVRAADPTKDLSYWYRLPEGGSNNHNNNNDRALDPPMVFAHGVGGLAFCYKLIDDILHDKTVSDQTPIILIDLPQVSLRINDEFPKIKSQIDSICNIIDDVVPRNFDRKGGQENLPNKATFVGHSYGTLLLSWMVQKRPERVAGCVFLGASISNILNASLLSFS